MIQQFHFWVYSQKNKNKNTNSKRYMHPYVHSNIIYNSQDMESTWVSINWWMDKEDVIYNKILLSHKRNEILPFAATRMDLDGIMLSDISQTEKDKYCLVSLWCGI